MISSATRNAIWQDLLDLARFVRYYEAVHRNYRRYHSTFRFLQGVSAFGILAILLSSLPGIFVSIGGFFIAIITLLDLIIDPGEKGVIAATISRDLKRLEVEQRELWESIDSGLVEEDDARNRQTNINLEVNNTTSGFHQVTNSRINEKCAKTFTM